MESLAFRPGRAFLSVNSPTVPWTAVFEDRSRETQEESILDGMLIYNVDALKTAAGLDGDAETPERLAAIEWSRDGLKAVLYLDGTPQALFDFAARRGFCRMNFPNFIAGQGDAWNRADHAWNDAALEHFEAALYA
jgi:hypothetical protein